jgi:hypothetical protein
MLQEKDWDTLLKRINDGKCTPFLGAGACSGVLPLGKDIAQGWAKEHNYPLKDCDDLARVAQFLAVDRNDPMFPKDEVARKFKNVVPPDFNKLDEPHGVMADLELPIYITTNYDDFMVQALRSRNKNPKLEVCRWNKYIKDQPSIFDTEPEFMPDSNFPIVFHLHGYRGLPESLVLTEDDYLDFLVNISRQQDLIPYRIQKALTGASLLFVGYSLVDWNFRVIFRGLVDTMEASLRRISVAVQLPREEKSQKYLTAYFKKADVLVYWGEARAFSQELRERWETFKKKGPKNA